MLYYAIIAAVSVTFWIGDLKTRKLSRSVSGKYDHVVLLSGNSGSILIKGVSSQSDKSSTNVTFESWWIVLEVCSVYTSKLPVNVYTHSQTTLLPWD